MHKIADIGAQLKAVNCNLASFLAASINDNTIITGTGFETTAYDSCKFVLTWKCHVADTKTFKISAWYQTSDDDSTYNTAVSLLDTVTVATGIGTTANDFSGVKEFDLSLYDKPKYIKFNFGGDLSATSADVAVMSGSAIVGGADSNPITQSS